MANGTIMIGRLDFTVKVGFQQSEMPAVSAGQQVHIQTTAHHHQSRQFEALSVTASGVGIVSLRRASELKHSEA
ncbi:hypothetical protein PENSUB_4610 [Penicillium subrubescens]|uniref:Uncharacterized protein n=1 Tax=Penicillium subrubescens TaxID=1316194 RepID=A0A1Q5UBX6_9EURO|nr:hypothetical protein PENSUB_4610 [Penicillium subrubescens]